MFFLVGNRDTFSPTASALIKEETIALVIEFCQLHDEVRDGNLVVNNGHNVYTQQSNKVNKAL